MPNSFRVKNKFITSSVSTFIKSFSQVVNVGASTMGESTISCNSIALTSGKFYKIEIYSLRDSRKLKCTSKFLK